MMILFQTFLLCLLPLVTPQSSVTAPPPVINGTKLLMSDDLPEDYHVATIASDVREDKAAENENISSPSLPIESSTAILVEENLIEKNYTSLPFVDNTPENATEKSIYSTIRTATDVPVSFVNISEGVPPLMERRSSTEDERIPDTSPVSNFNTETSVTKPYKLKKKILVSRTKISTETPPADNTESENSTINETFNNIEVVSISNDIVKLKAINDNSTATNVSNEVIERNDSTSEEPLQTSSTENYGIKYTTSSLAFSSLHKLVNNNLLNVIDTSVRPAGEDTTEALVETITRRGLAFSSNEYGPTGQTDWVPLVSNRGVGSEWVPLFSQSTQKMEDVMKSSLTARNDSDITTRVPRSTTDSTILAVSDGIIDSDDKSVSDSGNKEWNIPTEGASWVLASSLLTRQPQKTTEPTVANDVTYVDLVNNSLPQKSTNVETISTEEVVRVDTKNSTKDHNQVLKNTIPDSVIVETTPSDFKWRPVFTVPTPLSTTTKDELKLVSSKTVEITSDRITTPVIDENIDFTTTESDVVEQTVAYEILKIANETPERKTVVVTEESTNRIVTSTSVPNINEPGITVSESADVSTTIQPVTERIFGKVDEDNKEILEYTTIESVPMTSAIIVYSTVAKAPTSTSKIITTFTTSEAPTTFPPTTTSEKQPITPVVAPVLSAETTVHHVPTTATEIEATTMINKESETEQRNEKTDDENRTTSFVNDTVQSDGSESSIGEITEENVPAYLRLTVRTSEFELCNQLPELRAAVLKLLSEGTQTNVSSDVLVFLNLNPSICGPVIKERNSEDLELRSRPVNMFLMDAKGDFNKNLSEAFLTLWGESSLDFPLPILKVDFVTPIIEGEMPDGVSGGVVAAIVISCVAGLCLILLGVLFVIVKRRQKKFNYGQRCTPVSLDAYSLDSVSIRNSSRRKGIRASKRSYGNAAFDDPDVPTHAINFAGLANFSVEKEQVHEEFAVIPQVSFRAEELPPGVETLNRYSNVLPLPETRVFLTPRAGDPLSDYINANYVAGLNGVEKTYIAAQAPLDSTVPDWWRMVWENQIRVILMVTALQENGVEKCADYLPPNEVTDNLRLFGDYQVTLKKRDVKEKYIVSTLQLKNMETNLWREVKHLWYLGWPDSGVPAEPSSLIAFLIEARSQLKTSSGATTPTLVHCSPGTGRTGTVIACDLCIREFEQKRQVDIPRCVFHLRRARAGAVQTREQYSFIYQVLNTYATKLTGGVLENI